MISGDNAATVGAIAERAGIPGAETPVDARSEDPVAAVERASVFGRVNPDQKRDMVDALRGEGHTVAMTGTVSTTSWRSSAQISGSRWLGSPATRAVAQLVLLDSKWSSLRVVAEGRQVLGNIERVSDVFLTKACTRC